MKHEKLTYIRKLTNADLVDITYEFLREKSVLSFSHRLQILQSLIIFLERNKLVKEENLRVDIEDKIKSDLKEFLETVSNILDDLNLYYLFRRRVAIEAFAAINNKPLNVYYKWIPEQTRNTLDSMIKTYLEGIELSDDKNFKLPPKYIIESIIKNPFWLTPFRIELGLSPEYYKKSLIKNIISDYDRHIKKTTISQSFLPARNRLIISLYIGIFLNPSFNIQEITNKPPKLDFVEISSFPIRKAAMIDLILELMEFMGEKTTKDVVRNLIKEAFI